MDVGIRVAQLALCSVPQYHNLSHLRQWPKKVTVNEGHGKRERMERHRDGKLDKRAHTGRLGDRDVIMNLVEDTAGAVSARNVDIGTRPRQRRRRATRRQR